MASRLRLGAQAVAVAVVAALLALLVWKVAHPHHVPKGMAPNFTLPRLNGNGDLELASYRGQAVVLNFSASWCRPCRDEAPIFENLWRTYRDRGVVVLGVDSQDFRSRGRTFLRRYGVTYPVGFDGPGKIYDRYGLTGFPETFIVGRSGKLVHHFAGPIQRKNVPEVVGWIRRALAS